MDAFRKKKILSTVSIGLVSNLSSKILKMCLEHKIKIPYFKGLILFSFLLFFLTI